MCGVEQHTSKKGGKFSRRNVRGLGSRQYNDHDRRKAFRGVNKNRIKRGFVTYLVNRPVPTKYCIRLSITDSLLLERFGLVGRWWRDVLTFLQYPPGDSGYETRAAFVQNNTHGGRDRTVHHSDSAEGQIKDILIISVRRKIHEKNCISPQDQTWIHKQRRSLDLKSHNTYQSTR